MINRGSISLSVTIHQRVFRQIPNASDNLLSVTIRFARGKRSLFHRMDQRFPLILFSSSFFHSYFIFSYYIQRSINCGILPPSSSHLFLSLFRVVFRRISPAVIFSRLFPRIVMLPLSTTFFHVSDSLLVYLIGFAANDENSDQTPPSVLSPRPAPRVRHPPPSHVPSSSQVINTARRPARDRYGAGPDFRCGGGNRGINARRVEKSRVTSPNAKEERDSRMNYIRLFDNFPLSLFLFHIFSLPSSPPSTALSLSDQRRICVIARYMINVGRKNRSRLSFLLQHHFFLFYTILRGVEISRNKSNTRARVFRAEK